MIKKIPELLIAFLLFANMLFAQKVSEQPYQSRWKVVDSLFNQGLPQSAEKIIEDILAQAQKENQRATVIKAQLYLMTASGQREENSAIMNIQKAEAFIQQSGGAEKAIWQSIAAGFYWSYYEDNRHKIYNCTTIADNPSGDIDTWDVRQLIKKASELYLASIQEREVLKDIPVAQYLPLIIKGKNTEGLRPTLYDLLVFRAIAFFQNDEKDVINPAFKFEIDDEGYFAPAATFIKTSITSPDSLSLQLKALQLCQEIIASHLKDASPDALIDADLQRLLFVYEKSINRNKDTLMLAALGNLEKKYAGQPAIAQVSFHIARMMAGNNAVSYYFNNKSNDRDTINFLAVREKLIQIIQHYPGTEGAANAQNLLNDIEQKSLFIQMEQVALPGENSRALVQYRNMDTLFLKLYRIPVAELAALKLQDDNPGKLLHQQLVRSWQEILPGSGDYKNHSAEIKIEALPPGSYILLAASLADFANDSNVVTAVRFQVSGLSYIINNSSNDATRVFVLNRKTGVPLADIPVRLLSQKWSNKKSGYEYRVEKNEVSNKDGIIELVKDKSAEHYNAIQFVQGADTLFSREYLYHNYYPVDNPSSKTFTYFFTDRAIYRPGQTIYFKGIVIKHSGKSNNAIQPNYKTTVYFKDVNDQEIQKLELTTNEYGSFSGSFTAPESGLTGEMTIISETGSTSVSVEEYKRPKFYVEFDTVKDNYALNQSVTIKGFAKAYAGNNVDGAQVKYRVLRNARFPYYWCFHRWGMPESHAMEIKSGTAVTAADGSFEVNFTTIPDLKADPKTLPVFSYTVYADITDLNGETHSSNAVLNSGYRSLQIVASLPEDASTEDLKTIRVFTRNLNDVFTPAKVDISIAPLQFPGKLYRQRLWVMPDQFIMNETEFRQAFPDDEYKDEGNYLNWNTGSSVFEKSISTTADGTIAIPENVWKHNGWHVITIKAKDAQGNEIVEKKYTHVWNPRNPDPVQKDFVIQSGQQSYEPGQVATLFMGTAFERVNILGASSLKNYDIHQYKRPVVFEKRITEDDRGGIAFRWAYVFNNRMYEASAMISVPWSNKDLNVEWATHRDKLQPGAGDEWTMTIKGDKKEKVAAELLMGMYDAALDAFRPNRWNYNKLLHQQSMNDVWNGRFLFLTAQSESIKAGYRPEYVHYEKIYPYIDMYPYRLYRFVGSAAMTDGAAPGIQVVNGGGRPGSGDVLRIKGASAMNAAEDLAAPVLMEAPPVKPVLKFVLPNEVDSASPYTNQPISIRTNLQETAFFFPQLQTDSNGNISFKFTMPEALTEWKLMAFAHTKDWKTGYLEGKIKTQKDLMVMPNLPRFFRQGDDMVIATKINSLADKDLSGIATLEILNAETLQPLDLPFHIQSKMQDFSVAPHQSATANWNIHIPESIYTPVVVRITARAGDFTDGEENTLPVITNRILITETLPMPVQGNQTKTFVFDKLKNTGSASLVHHALTVEFTGNPAWYAVQALPYLMEFPYECAEQTFNRYYANALAGYIVAQSPKMEAIFNQWNSSPSEGGGRGEAALLSHLSKNQELKSALLEETPWVLEAKNETEQQRRIALLFDTRRLAKELDNNLDMLSQMQLPEGGFPWFRGMTSDRYITQYIITGLARLQHLGVKSAVKDDAAKIQRNALPYLDRQLKEDYDNLIRYKADMDKQHVGYIQVQYLYMRSFFPDKKVNPAVQEAFDYYLQQAARFWPQFNPYLKGMAALALHRLNDKKTAQQIMASLAETATHHEELGMYWKTMTPGYRWYEAPIEAQSLLIEAFQEVAQNRAATDSMKTWLLKQKQTQSWATTKATADACYALLLNGSDWLDHEPVVTIDLGDVKTIKSSEIKTEAGTGYFKEIIDGKDVRAEMGTIKVNIQHSTSKIQNSVSWGAVYWQYFEDMDKITSAATPLALSKQLYIEQNSDRGPVLTEIKDGNELRVGDKVKVRIVLKADRDMEYVHLKNMRAACFEPLNVLSGYKYQGGLGYYESTKDIATHFFFDYLPKGTYVFEYPVFVGQKGSFSNGIASIQCMYAPEFSSHTEGTRVEVK